MLRLFTTLKTLTTSKAGEAYLQRFKAPEEFKQLKKTQPFLEKKNS